MRLIYLVVFIYSLSFSQSPIVKLYENIAFDGISKLYSELKKINTLLTWDNRISSIKVKIGYQITIFEKKDYKGKKITLTSDFANLKKVNFNDKISSIIIEKYDRNSDAGSIYDDIDYEGTMYNLKVGDYNNLKELTWLNDKATSIKVASGYKIIAFEHYDFKGKSLEIKEDQANLKTLDWNDKISSMKVEMSNIKLNVEDGFICRVYGDSYFSGEYKDFDLVRVNNLNDWNDEISSIKISKNYQITIYEHSDFKGKKTTITSNNANLRTLKWNDKISSLVVENYYSESNVTTIFEDSHFSGAHTTLGIGEYNNLKKQTWFNDNISSIKIDNGYKVTVYKDADFKGSKKTLFSSSINLKSIKFNDNISSLKINKLSPGEFEKLKPNYVEVDRNIKIILSKVDSVKEMLYHIEQKSRGHVLIKPNQYSSANSMKIEKKSSNELYNEKEFKFIKKSLNGIQYVGLHKNGIPNGIGRMKFNNGDEFIGQIKQGNPEGLGLITKPDGTYLKGIFTSKKDGIFCLLGKGKSKSSESTIEGNISNNEPFGKVKIIHSSGAVYEGDFFNDMPWTGKGKIIKDDMSIEGEFIEAQGLAFIKDSKMSIYGEVLLTKNKKFNIYGFYLNNEGDQLSGEIKNGKLKKMLPKNEVINSLKQKYKTFDHEKLKLVLPN